MYYPQQSPAIAHKLATHDPWQRAHHPVLGPPGTQPAPPQSPGYGIYTNGAVHHPHSMVPMHHHQGSMSQYQSPPTHQQHVMVQGSPANVSLTQHWQQQLLKCEMVRSSRSPHHRARQSAMASRTVTKSAIPITNPNLVKPPDPDPLLSLTASDSSPTTTAAVADHPSSIVAPVSEVQRPTEVRPPQSTWNSLDMGGVNIKNIPPTSGLFSFSFLTNLYLNHNSLTSVPPQISKLRHLELLDLSGNNLTNLPSELGMLIQLKELYFFDNHITNLPPELGFLHQLQTMGIEGNPLESSLTNIVQTSGTRALVSYLRDNAPSPPKPPTRQWQYIASQQECAAFASDPSVETFTVLCFNVLCERAATERLYGYTPNWALNWNYRKDVILGELRDHASDFMCLQEVDIAQYEGFFLKNLAEMGYEGVYWPKSRYKTMNEQEKRLVDGSATFYKSSKYNLVEKHLIEFSALAMQRQDFKKTDDMFNRVLGKDHIAVVCLFEQKQTGTRFIIVNPHLHWDTAYRDVKLVQTALLVDELEKIAEGFALYPPRPPPTPPANATAFELEELSKPFPSYSDGTKIPIIIAGDFNSVPSSGVYEYLSNGVLPPNHPDFLSHTYGRYTSEGLRHKLGLRSAYASLSEDGHPASAPHQGGQGGLPMTNYTPGFAGVLDYIWYSASTLSVTKVLDYVDRGYLDKVVGFPNVHFPSDHLKIVSEFKVRTPKEVIPPSRQVQSTASVFS